MTFSSAASSTGRAYSAGLVQLVLDDLAGVRREVRARVEGRALARRPVVVRHYPPVVLVLRLADRLQRQDEGELLALALDLPGAGLLVRIARLAALEDIALSPLRALHLVRRLLEAAAAARQHVRLLLPDLEVLVAGLAVRRHVLVEDDHVLELAAPRVARARR